METKEKNNQKSLEETNEQPKKINEIINKIVSWFGKFKKKTIIVIAICLACLIVGGLIIMNLPGKVTTETFSALKEVIDVKEISTVEYTYTSIVTVKNEKEDKYHVSYNGVVKAGFDGGEIVIEEDVEQKKILITIPPIKVLSAVVDDKSLDYIFMKEKYNTETTFQEAFKECTNDLINKANSNYEVMELAKKNATVFIETFIKALGDRIPSTYTIEYKWN